MSLRGPSNHYKRVTLSDKQLPQIKVKELTLSDKVNVLIRDNALPRYKMDRPIYFMTPFEVQKHILLLKIKHCLSGANVQFSFKTTIF